MGDRARGNAEMSRLGEFLTRAAFFTVFGLAMGVGIGAAVTPLFALALWVTGVWPLWTLPVSVVVAAPICGGLMAAWDEL